MGAVSSQFSTRRPGISPKVHEVAREQNGLMRDADGGDFQIRRADARAETLEVVELGGGIGIEREQVGFRLGGAQADAPGKRASGDERGEVVGVEDDEDGLSPLRVCFRPPLRA